MRGVLLIALALFDLFAFVRAIGSIWRGVSAHRRVAARIRCSTSSRSRPAGLHRGRARPLAFCSGLLRPRVFVSEGTLERLGEDELAAVVEHEAHHAARRDPLRILIARAIGDAYSLGALGRREQALSELAADDAAVRSRGAGFARLGAADLPRRIGADRARARGSARRARPRGEIPARWWPARGR